MPAKKSNKRWTPPKKTTITVSLAVLVLGLVIGIGGYMGQFPVDLIPISMNTNTLFVIIAFFLPLISWFLMYLGVITKGL